MIAAVLAGTLAVAGADPALVRNFAGLPAGTTLLDEAGRPDGAELTLEPGGRPGLELSLTTEGASADWSGWAAARLDLGNPGTRPLRLDVDLLGPARAGGDTPTAHYEATVAPGGRISWRLPLLHLRYTYAWTWPAQPGLSDLQSWGDSKDMRVATVGIHLMKPGRRTRLRLYRLRLDEPVSATGWVDRFGQRATGSWAGKVFSEADLTDQDAREDAALAALAPAPARDEYRAWNGRPGSAATGFFRVERSGGVWWLVAPNGHSYWSSAVDCVVHGIEARLDEASRPAYSWLPPDAGEFAAAWGHGPGQPDTHWPAFYRINLVRKWGASGEQAKWREKAYRRLLAWNFTGLGNWCDESLFRDHRLPYVTMGPQTWLARLPYAGDKLQDVYDPAFDAEAAKAAAPLAAWKDDPWCVGHFIENECGWADLPGSVLGKPAAQPAKARFLALLRERYRSVADLNAAWKVAATSFESARLPDDEDAYTAAALRDAARFRGEFAERYFRGWAAAIRAVDPHHLLLGGRFHGGNRQDEVLAACGKACDVVSVNHYSTEIPRAEFDRWHAVSGKPLLIGEYAFDSLDRGLLTTAVPVADQQERAVGYRYYTEQAAALPYVVGAHYFQYLDEPVTGRFDRETSFNGLVNVADVPDETLTVAARETNERLYWLHLGQLAPFAQRPRR